MRNNATDIETIFLKANHYSIIIIVRMLYTDSLFEIYAIPLKSSLYQLSNYYSPEETYALV
jgi:hypothetical protein